MKEIIIKNKALLIGVFLSVLAFFPALLHLDVDKIFMWDESRLAVNAAEMVINGNYFIPTYNNKPDMWNTKPPLMVWFQATLMNVFGINTLSVRLPSAIALLLIFALNILFLRKYFNNTLVGLISGFAIITCEGFISIHIARTGDYDALLSLFTTFYALFFFISINENGKLINKNIIIGALFTILAFYTKTIQGLIFIPVIYLFILIKSRYHKTAFLKLLLASIIISGICVAYYLIREIYNKGYIEASLYNDVTGRYLGSVVAPKKWDYYLNHLLSFSYSYLFYSLPIAVYFSIRYRKQKLGIFLQYLLINVFFYLFVIQLSKSKGLQYLAPIYPLMSITFAISLYYLFLLLSSRFKFFQHKIVVIALLLLLFTPPYIKIVQNNLTPYSNHGWWSTMYGAYMHRVKEKKPEITSIKVIHEGYNAHLDFYILADKQNSNVIFERVNQDQLKPEDYVLFCGSGYFKDLKTKYNFEIIDENQNCYLIKLLESIQHTETTHSN